MTSSQPDMMPAPTHRPLTRRARAAERAARNAARADPRGPEDFGSDPEVLRAELMRRMFIFLGNRTRRWRDCAEPACRRARCCRAPRVQCSNSEPPPPRSPERAAQAQADFHRMLREVIERRLGGT